MISLSRQSAHLAPMPPLAQVFPYVCAAETRLTRPARVYLDEITPGTCSLVRDFLHESSPSGIVDRLRQHSAGQPFDVQIFDGDQAVTINNFTRLLMMEIGALLLDMGMSPLEKLHGLTSALRAFLAPRNSALGDSQ